MIVPMAFCETDGPACFIALGWHADMLASFLAVWMPLNLIAWLTVVLYFAIEGNGVKDCYRTLVWTLWMTLAFLPWVAGVFCYATLLAYLDIRRERRERREQRQRQFA